MKAFFGMFFSAIDGVFKLAAGAVGLIGFGFLLVVIYFIGKLFFTVSSLDDDSGMNAQKEALQNPTVTQEKVNSVEPVLYQPQSDNYEIPAMLNNQSASNQNVNVANKAPLELHEFKRMYKKLCRGGGEISYENDDIGKIQCQTVSRDLIVSLNYDKGDYRDITITMNLGSKHLAPLTVDFVESVKLSLGILGKNPEIANNFTSLPLSPDWNKTTLIKGVKFNIPDKGGVERYGNYMLTITK